MYSKEGDSIEKKPPFGKARMAGPARQRTFGKPLLLRARRLTSLLGSAGRGNLPFPAGVQSSCAVSTPACSK